MSLGYQDPADVVPPAPDAHRDRPPKARPTRAPRVLGGEMHDAMPLADQPDHTGGGLQRMAVAAAPAGVARVDALLHRLDTGEPDRYPRIRVAPQADIDGVA